MKREGRGPRDGRPCDLMAADHGPPNAVAAVLNTVLGAKTMFPRHANDEILNLAADRGHSMWNILTVQVGGSIPGLLPKAPTSPTDR